MTKTIHQCNKFIHVLEATETKQRFLNSPCMLTHGKAGCAYKTTVWLPSNSTATRHLKRLLIISSFTFSDNFNLQSSLAERHVFHTALQVFKIFKSTTGHSRTETKISS